MQRDYIQLSDEVEGAIKKHLPVVTLESTIIALGLPYPHNLKVARECEAIVRKEGAVPATVGVVKGSLKVGLSDSEIEAFATRKDVVKANLSNLSVICASGGWGATSVSTSLFATVRAGASVFVTGGIGGVHKGFGESFDISSDLTALQRFCAIVVSAGIKTLLDVPATLERLETLGVPVLGFGTDKFPVFYTPTSPYPVDLRVDTPEEVVRVFQTHREMGLQSGILVAVPVPEKEGLPAAGIDAALKAADANLARRPDVRGRAVTPFLLERLEKITKGRTLAANLSLIKNNARIGAHIACALTHES